MGTLPLSLLLLLLPPPLLWCLLQSSSSRNQPPPLPAPPAVAAAAPVLEDRPFVVVWNIPTARCQDGYGVHLDLSHFDIVHNHEQHFQGQEVTIFYRDRLGKYPYLTQRGEEVNGGVPQRGHLEDHLTLVSQQLSVSLQPNFTGLAVIDWEEWRPLWDTNFGSKLKYRRLSKRLVKQQRPDLPEKAVSALARCMFEESARRFMEQTLLQAVRNHPKGLWGFYGFPICSNKHKRKTNQTYTGRCHRGTRPNNDRLSWLWARSTALYPSIYLPQRLAGSADAALMVRNRLLEVVRVASLWRHGNATPILPYARLAFTHTLNFLSKVDLEHTLGESASLGAAGVVLWGETKFAKSKKQCILLRDYINNTLGPFLQSLRSDTQRCSQLLCHGNGRCAQRRPPTSVHRPWTSAPSSRTPTEAPRQAECQCYEGWAGLRCQDRRRT